MTSGLTSDKRVTRRMACPICGITRSISFNKKKGWTMRRHLRAFPDHATDFCGGSGMALS